jgi:imidazolonepropionase-like amidohydrolase
MHVHTLLRQERVELFFPAFIANGILGVRDMASPPEEFEHIKQWRKETAQGTLLGPRVVAAGPLVDGPNPMFPELSITVASEAEGRQAVRALKQRGADFVKVYSLLTRDAYFAIADEAKRQAIPFAGHVPESVNAGEASDAGQRSIEHLSGITLACSASEAELRKELIDARAKSDPSLIYSALRLVQTKGRETYSEKKAEALFARFVENDTWQVPTLTVARAVASVNDSNTTSDPRLNKLLSARRKARGPNNNTCFKDLTAEYSAFANGESQRAFELVAAMHRRGVKFMAGTDAPNPWVFPGTSLHEELALLVLAGFTPAEALQTATLNPAKYLGLLDSLGTVEKGKIADLVLLEANPLDDISNTRKISAVVVRGKMIGKPELQKILRELESSIAGKSCGQCANSPPQNASASNRIRCAEQLRAARTEESK